MSTDEKGIYEMTESGWKQNVTNIFAQGRQAVDEHNEDEQSVSGKGIDLRDIHAGWDMHGRQQTNNIASGVAASARIVCLSNQHIAI